MEAKMIAFWGIGKICGYCLEQYSNLMPELFIDKFSEKIYHSKKVKYPDEINNWLQYYNYSKRI